MSDASTAAWLTFGGICVNALISLANNRKLGTTNEKLTQVAATTDLTHIIVNSQKTAMEKLVQDQSGTIAERDATIAGQQQRLHDAGSIEPAP